MSVSGIGSCGSSQNAAAIQQLQSVIGLRNLTGMKDQPVSGASTSQPSWASPRDTFRSDLASLFSAVQSGDIQGAQSALSTLQNDQAATYGANGQVTRQTIGQDFASLTQAISSGDTSGAQKALQTLQTDFQTFSAQHPHHHHHGSGAGLFAPANGNTKSTASLTPAISTTSTDQDHDGDQS